MLVTLTDAEIQYAEHTGKARNEYNKGMGFTPTYGAPRYLAMDIEGVLAEIAVGKGLNVPWDEKRFGNIVTGPMGEVHIRSTTHLTGSLILHPRDQDDAVYLLVLNNNPNFTLAGWLLGKDGKLDKYWREAGVRHPAFFVPQSALHPVEDLQPCA